MKAIRKYVIIQVLFFIGGCLPQGVTDRLSPSGEEALNQGFSTHDGAFVFIQPLPQESHRLRFLFEDVSAMRDDGVSVPLSLNIKEIKGGDMFADSQRLLATGALPEGSYGGLSIKIKKAFVLGEEGESELLIPQEPIFSKHRFKVTPRKAFALFLTLNPTGAITDGLIFTPIFNLTTSTRELISITGYISLSDLNMIAVFDKKKLQILDVISTTEDPKGIVLDRRRGRLYVATSGDDNIAEIDIFRREIVRRLKLNFGDNPIELALTSDARTLLSINSGSNTVSLIDVGSFLERRRISVGKKPTSAALDPSGSIAYITNSLSNTLSVIDLTQRTISVTIQLQATPFRAAVNRRGDSIYVIHRDSPNLTVINSTTFSSKDDIYVGMGAFSLELDFQTDRILVGKKSEREISIIEPFSLMPVDAIQIDGDAANMTIDIEENSLYVVSTDRAFLRKISLTSNRIMSQLPLMGRPYDVIVMGER